MESSAPTTVQETTLRFRLRRFTPMLVFLTFYLSLAALNFGYDVGTFGGVQGMNAFKQQFGTYNAKTKKYALATIWSSMLNSFPFLGKLIGALACGPIAERYGRKSAVGILAIVSLVGVTLQTSATTPAQFLIGRIINFAMTGFCIVVTPIYQSECSPQELRGLITATIQFQISLGGVVASAINYGTSNMVGNKAWRIPIGLQFVVPVIILALLPLMPESPRWLITRDRHDAARHSLRRLRATEDIEQELAVLEATPLNHEKGPWSELFKGDNRRRTTIAILAMFFQQITGQAFVSQYSVVFYQREGITNSFQLGLIGSCAGLVCTIFTSLVVDGFGRRPILLAGGSLMATVLFIFGGIGTIGDPNAAEKHLMVACNILFGCFYGLSWAPLSYVVLGEVAATRAKEKTNNVAVCISVVTTFVISFTIPYLLNAPYANLGAKVGFIYGSTTVLSVVCAYLFIPEMKGLSLEQINVLFKNRVPTRRFREVAKGMPADFETQEIEVQRAKLGSADKGSGHVDERSIVSGM